MTMNSVLVDIEGTPLPLGAGGNFTVGRVQAYCTVLLELPSVHAMLLAWRANPDVNKYSIYHMFAYVYRYNL